MKKVHPFLIVLMWLPAFGFALGTLGIMLMAGSLIMALMGSRDAQQMLNGVGGGAVQLLAISTAWTAFVSLPIAFFTSDGKDESWNKSKGTCLVLLAILIYLLHLFMKNI